MITKCTVCNGKKEVMGLGCIVKECATCNGVGHVTVVLSHDAVADKLYDDTNVSVVVKARGRPKKIEVSDERVES